MRDVEFLGWCQFGSGREVQVVTVLEELQGFRGGRRRCGPNDNRVDFDLAGEPNGIQMNAVRGVDGGAVGGVKSKENECVNIVTTGEGDTRDMHEKLLIGIALQFRLIIQSLRPSFLDNGSSGLGSGFC